MTITRIIDGKTVQINLTYQEMIDVFMQWQKQCDKEDIELALDTLGISLSDDEQLDKIAERYRRRRENDDLWFCIAQDEINNILKPKIYYIYDSQTNDLLTEITAYSVIDAEIKASDLVNRESNQIYALTEKLQDADFDRK